MATNYSEIVKNLTESVTSLRNEANHYRIKADEARIEAEKYQQRALTLDNMGDKKTDQECRSNEEECIQRKNSLINNTDKR